MNIIKNKKRNGFYIKCWDTTVCDKHAKYKVDKTGRMIPVFSKKAICTCLEF